MGDAVSSKIEPTEIVTASRTGTERIEDEQDDSWEKDAQIQPPGDLHQGPHSGASSLQNNAWTKWVRMVADQWFLLALGLLIAIASQVQVPLVHQQLKRSLTSYICISIIFFM